MILFQLDDQLYPAPAVSETNPEDEASDLWFHQGLCHLWKYEKQASSKFNDSAWINVWQDEILIP